MPGFLLRVVRDMNGRAGSGRCLGCRAEQNRVCAKGGCILPSRSISVEATTSTGWDQAKHRA